MVWSPWPSLSGPWTVVASGTLSSSTWSREPNFAVSPVGSLYKPYQWTVKLKLSIHFSLMKSQTIQNPSHHHHHHHPPEKTSVIYQHGLPDIPGNPNLSFWVRIPTGRVGQGLRPLWLSEIGSLFQKLNVSGIRWLYCSSNSKGN